MQRKEPLANGEVYHITNKSIAGYRIFHTDADYVRLLQMIRFFSYDHALPKFSRFLEFARMQDGGFEATLKRNVQEKNALIRIIAYCIMPTHIHLVLEQRKSDGISTAVGNILNTFARYFNVKHDRQGPLWTGRFKNIHVDSDDQLLHLTRYVHLNPVSADLVDDAAQWKYSSHREYIALRDVQHPICDFQGVIDMSPGEYRKFVNDRAGYQRELALIKHLATD